MCGVLMADGKLDKARENHGESSLGVLARAWCVMMWEHSQRCQHVSQGEAQRLRGCGGRDRRVGMRGTAPGR